MLRRLSEGPTAQAVNRRPLTAEDRVQFQPNPYELWGGRSVSGTDFSPSIQFSPVKFHSTIAFSVTLRNGTFTGGGGQIHLICCFSPNIRRAWNSTLQHTILCTEWQQRSPHITSCQVSSCIQRNMEQFNVLHELSKCPKMREEVPSPIQLPITVCQRKVPPRARANTNCMFMERFI
jgi:hypothetical protein